MLRPIGLDLRRLQVILRMMQNNETAILSILRTETQRDLLVQLCFRSDRSPTLTDLARSIGVDQTTVMREVNRLLEAGILTEERVGRSRTIQINEASPFAVPLRQLMRLVISETRSGSHDHRVIFHGGPDRSEDRHDRRPLPSSRRRI